MKNGYDLVEVSISEDPARKTRAKRGMWQQRILKFMNSGMFSARVTSDNTDTSAQRRAYNGLIMAIRHNFADANISVAWRNGDIYLLKGFGQEDDLK